MSSYKKNAFTYSTIVAMGGFLFGLDAALISGTTKFISKEFALSTLELGTVVSAPAWGVLLALLFAGWVSNRFGRKRAIQIIAILYIVSAVSSAFAPSYVMLVIARFLGGLAFTSISMASMYIGEIAPQEYRGKLVSMIQINIVIGLSAAYFLNYLIIDLVSSGAPWVSEWGIDTNTWRWMLGTEIIPAILWLGLLFIVPRSPSWLMFQGRIDEAKITLKKLIPENQVDQHIDDMQDSLSKSSSDHSLRAQFKEIMGKPMRVTLIIALTIAIAQQATGINAILFYAQTVIEQLGIGSDASFLQAIWIGLTSVVFTILGLLLVDKLGRRPLIIYGMIWIVLSLGLCSFGFYQARYTITADAVSEMKEIPNAERLKKMVDVEYKSDAEFKNALKETLGEADARDFSGLLIQKSATMNAMLIFFGILSFIAAFHFSVGPVMWVLFSEIFPISIRGIAIPAITLITSLVSMLVQQFFPWQLDQFGISTTLLIYAIVVAIGLIILFKYLVETKGLTIEEIQDKLQSK
ncbi:MFS transporter [Tamlana fucoidanivorans]|uniref:Sugar porter family MFS transporter n=1 Tax=Allotamlana fucoidanivorans TaxID=2583814 RepID=A0A5C4SFN4_9FLAO|nr:MFS transporter [Tamlana fucoidanivorans]TNJ42404.1 sugar porter family MFS transporter [Tamlana fucoidanivorans]